MTVSQVACVTDVHMSTLNSVCHVYSRFGATRQRAYATSLSCRVEMCSHAEHGKTVPLSNLFSVFVSQIDDVSADDNNMSLSSLTATPGLAPHAELTAGS